MNDYEKLIEQFPFLSICKKDKERHLYVGIILNQTKNWTSMYLIDKIDPTHKTEFLGKAGSWWHESNRKLPISIFLQNDFDKFEYALDVFNTKQIEVMLGPITKLSNIVSKRIKRTTISLSSDKLKKKINKGIKRKG